MEVELKIAELFLNRLVSGEDFIGCCAGSELELLLGSCVFLISGFIWMEVSGI